MFQILILFLFISIAQAEELSSLEQSNIDCFNAFWNYNEHGIGTTQEAFKICLDSANAGGVGAQNLVAEGYLGAGNKQKALYWFKKASTQGHKGAKSRVLELSKRPIFP